jgi:hypothetical protein
VVCTLVTCNNVVGGKQDGERACSDPRTPAFYFWSRLEAMLESTNIGIEGDIAHELLS